MKKVLFGTTLFLTLGSAFAADSPSWNYVNSSYQSTDLGGEDLNGFSFSGSKILNENIFVDGGYSSVSFKESDGSESAEIAMNQLSLGLGAKTSVSPTTDVFGIISYESFEVELDYSGYYGNVSESNDENGYGLYLGVKSLITPKIEVTGAIGRISINDDSEMLFSGKAAYHFNDQFSLTAEFENMDEMDTFRFGASLRF